VQLATVGKEVFRGAKKAQKLEATGAGDPQVQERLQKLKQVEAFRELGMSWGSVAYFVG